MDARWTIVAATLAIASCGGGDEGWSGSGRNAVHSIGESSVRMAAAQSVDAVPAEQAAPGDVAVRAEPSESYLAYTYQQRLELPGTRLAGVMDGHIAACQAAGDGRCQLMASARDGAPDARMTGTL